MEHLRRGASYFGHTMQRHVDRMALIVEDLGEHEVAARAEGYIPTWLDDIAALVGSMGHLSRGPKAFRVSGFGVEGFRFRMTLCVLLPPSCYYSLQASADLLREGPIQCPLLGGTLGS